LVALERAEVMVFWVNELGNVRTEGTKAARIRPTLGHADSSEMTTSGDRDAPDPESTWSWLVVDVDRRGDHLALWHTNIENPVAVVGPPSGQVFPVELDAPDSTDPDVLEEVRRELDYYLVELGEPDPWAYAIYHARTIANIYGPVHWSWHPAGSEGNQ
jgi:hypothetical protein